MPGTGLITTKREKKNDAVLEPHVCAADLGDADAQQAHEKPAKHQHGRREGALHGPSPLFATIRKTPVPTLIAAAEAIAMKDRRPARGHRRCRVRGFTSTGRIARRSGPQPAASAA